MTHFYNYISLSIFYGIAMCENVCIARSSYVSIFYEKTIALITRMEKHGENREKLIKHILKAYENHLFVLHKYDISNRDILKRFWWHFLGYTRSKGVDWNYHISLFGMTLPFLTLVTSEIWIHMKTGKRQAFEHSTWKTYCHSIWCQ